MVKLKSSRLITGFVTRLTRRVPLVEQELLSLPNHLSSPPDFSGVRVTRSLVLCVCFVDRCLPFCTFSFDHCVVCSSIYRYGFGLPILTIVLSVLRYTGTDSDYPFWPLCCLFFDIPVRILITSLLYLQTLLSIIFNFTFSNQLILVQIRRLPTWFIFCWLVVVMNTYSWRYFNWR